MIDFIHPYIFDITKKMSDLEQKVYPSDPLDKVAKGIIKTELNDLIGKRFMIFQNSTCGPVYLIIPAKSDAAVLKMAGYKYLHQFGIVFIVKWLFFGVVSFCTRRSRSSGSAWPR